MPTHKLKPPTIPPCFQKTVTPLSPLRAPAPVTQAPPLALAVSIFSAEPAQHEETLESEWFVDSLVEPDDLSLHPPQPIDSSPPPQFLSGVLVGFASAAICALIVGFSLSSVTAPLSTSRRPPTPQPAAAGQVASAPIAGEVSYFHAIAAQRAPVVTPAAPRKEKTRRAKKTRKKLASRQPPKQSRRPKNPRRATIKPR